MPKNIVFDLEGVLIPGLHLIRLHPEARTVLDRSVKEFNATYLWTHVEFDEAIDVLDLLGIRDFFDVVIAYQKENYNHYTKIFNLCNNRHIHIPFDCNKDLNTLGNPLEFVLIDDMEDMGFPRERVVIVESYTGMAEEKHSLIIPYEKALKLF